jgi:hypothetical protein
VYFLILTLFYLNQMQMFISESKKRNITKVLQIETSDQGKY